MNYELFHVKHSPAKLQVSPGQVFDRAVLSAHGSESEYVREDEETVSASRPRVPVPNARLNLRRKAAGLVLRMFRLHDRRSSPAGPMFRLVRLNLSKPAGIALFSG